MLGFIPGLLPGPGRVSDGLSNAIALFIKERIFIYTEKRIIKKSSLIDVGENTNIGVKRRNNYY